MRKNHYLLRSIFLGLLLLSQTALAFPIRLGLSPDNNQSLLISTLRSARQELLINIYEFDQPAIAEAIIDRIEAGVTVRILIEGQPVGKVSSSGEKVIRDLSRAMSRSRNSRNRLFVMENKESRRYRYDHAKYVTVDSQSTLISSENFTSTGHADSGKVGNRGWEVVIENKPFTQKMLALFRTDTDLSYGDVTQVSPTQFEIAKDTESEQAAPARQVPALPEGYGEAKSAKLITSPDSLSGLVSVIRSAREHLEIEEMSLPSIWKSPEPGQSPLVTELIAAARRGVSVRVLLNDEWAFGTAAQPAPGDAGVRATAAANAAKKKPNEITVELLQSLRTCERLPIEARIVNVRKTGITYIHNKGILVDGKKALVSSINGTQNSVENNREVAVLLDSVDAATYFGEAFDFDWAKSAPAKKPSKPVCSPIRTETPQLTH